MSNGCCENKFSQDCYKKLDEFINSFEDKRGILIAVLHKAQGLFGYLPPEIQEYVAKKLGISLAQVYGVVSFYSYFTMTPKGKYPIAVCMGTACYVRGADKLLEEFKRIIGIGAGETTPDGQFSIDALRCIGACGLAPVLMVKDKVYGRLVPEQVKAIIEEYKNA